MSGDRTRRDLCPNAELGYVEPAKLRDYVLDPAHERGRHKARVFASALGFTQEDWPVLAALVVEGLQRNPVTSTRGAHGGLIYEVVMPIARSGRTAVRVTTAWQLDVHGRPRLVTAYVRV